MIEVGIVEDINDPSQLNRVRVRVIGIHTDDKSLLPTNRLPWATVIMPATYAQNSGAGGSHGLLNGSSVSVIFADGADKQIPFVLGSITNITKGIPNYNRGFSDENRVYPIQTYIGKSDLPNRTLNDSTRDDIAEKNVPSGLISSWQEPSDNFSPEYPNNYVISTYSGHQIELDNTSGKERVNIEHRTGTKTEIVSNGDMVKKIVNDSYEIVANNDYVYIKGFSTSTIGGNLQILVEGSCEVVVNGNANLKVRGNCQTNVDGTIAMVSKGDMYLHSDKNVVISGTQVHFNSPNMALPNNLCPELDITATQFATQNDEIETDSTMSDEELLSNIKRDGGDSIPESKVDDNTPPSKDNPWNEVPADCADFKNGVNADTLLSSHWTIASLTTKTLFPHRLRSQHGLSEKEIACNMRALVKNVLEPISRKYGLNKITINSGFRQGSGSSQHERGEAVDISFRGWSEQDYRDAMKWIKDNLKVDQIILEKQRTNWIHISYKSSGNNRQMVLTRTRPGVYKSGIWQTV
jgi:hypothetical protein